MVDPRISTFPDGDEDLAERTLELAAETPLDLDDWQQYALRKAMRTRPNGNWAAKEVGVCVARQNGKGGILEIREVAEIDLVPHQRDCLVLHSAHEFATASQHFERLRYLIEETPRLSKQMKKGGVKVANGKEGFYFKGERSIQFRARTKGGSRGYSADLVVLDEAMDLPAAVMAAMFPTKRARPNPQVWYTGSAVDQQMHEHGVTFTRLRERGVKGDDVLAWLEWSVEGGNPETVPMDTLLDGEAHKRANPAIGIRIDPEGFYDELRSLGPRAFAVEILGIGDWPRTDHVATNPIDYDSWAALADDGVIQTPEFVSFDVSPERKGAIVIAGRRKDGLIQAELVESKGGTAWVAPRVADLVKKHRVEPVCDGRGPAFSLVPELRDLGIEVETLNATDHAAACGHLVDAVERQSFRHLNDPELNAAVQAAVTRPLGDAWAWSRKDSSTNIAPLVAFTLAVSAALTHEKPRKAAFAVG